MRGHGLFLGIELVTDRAAKAPNPVLAEQVANALRGQGVLISTDGPNHNVLKIKPPMVISAAEADEVVSALGQVLMGL